ncbi:MAG: DUF1385 domain-containing protein [Lachnospiraceae bacterium]|nr:DUF1385 domain-containing protein [Lachnospiraceae bacterium]
MEKNCNAKYSGIGGQAVMEGVMMRNKDDYAVAVRKPDGEMAVIKDKYTGIIPSETVSKIPILRGIAGFIDSLVLGMKAINYSADFFAEEEDGEKKDGTAENGSSDKAPEKKTGKIEVISPPEKSGGMGALSIVVTVVALFFSLGLFMVIPYYLSLVFSGWIGSTKLLALIEGIIRLGIFVLYIKAISLMEDIKRVFRYHGAEHKCINCLETGHELNLENVRAASREHRRCGTSFLLYVMVVSILFFSFIDLKSRILRAALRIILIPLIAGVAYEFIRLAGRSNNPFVRSLSAPGLLMQKLTTAEPDDEMILVGIASVEAVFDWKKYLKENFGNDIQ